jgi:hypothetical protein
MRKKCSWTDGRDCSAIRQLISIANLPTVRCSAAERVRKPRKAAGDHLDCPGRGPRVANAQVLKLLASCEVTADQFLIGSFGHTAFEAMALGRAVLCYIRDPAGVTGAAECPIIQTDPDRLYTTLKWFFSRTERRWLGSAVTDAAMSSDIARSPPSQGGSRTVTARRGASLTHSESASDDARRHSPIDKKSTEHG